MLAGWFHRDLKQCDLDIERSPGGATKIDALIMREREEHFSLSLSLIMQGTASDRSQLRNKTAITPF